MTVTNTISQDQGYFKISKVFGSTAYTGDFTMNYVCTDTAATTGSVALGAGETSAVIGPIDTYKGTTAVTCTVVEVLPANPIGYTFDNPSYSPTGGAVTISKGNAAAAALVTVTNTISRDLGSLEIVKTVNAGTSGFTTGSFPVHVECILTGSSTLIYDRTIAYPTPGYVTIDNIPSLYSCTVTEGALPTAPVGYFWGSPVITGSPVVIAKNTTKLVTVANSLSAGTSKIAPTQTTCQMYRDGEAEDYNTLNYLISKGKVGSVSPGMIFFWSTITAPSSDFTLLSNQTKSDASWYFMKYLDVFLWDENCVKVQSVTITGDGFIPTLEVTGAIPGDTYFFSVKYDTSSLTGAPKPALPTVVYWFETYLNGSMVFTSPDSIAVVPKPKK